MNRGAGFAPSATRDRHPEILPAIGREPGPATAGQPRWRRETGPAHGTNPDDPHACARGREPRTRETGPRVASLLATRARVGEKQRLERAAWPAPKFAQWP